MNKKGFVPIILILVISGLLAIGGGGAWYLVQYKQEKASTPPHADSETKKQVSQKFPPSTEKDSVVPGMSLSVLFKDTLTYNDVQRFVKDTRFNLSLGFQSEDPSFSILDIEVADSNPGIILDIPPNYVSPTRKLFEAFQNDGLVESCQTNPKKAEPYHYRNTPYTATTFLFRTGKCRVKANISLGEIKSILSKYRTEKGYYLNLPFDGPSFGYAYIDVSSKTFQEAEAISKELETYPQVDTASVGVPGPIVY